MRFLSLVLLLPMMTIAADRQNSSRFDPSYEHPHGLINPDAPPETAEFAFMVGRNDCVEEKRDPQSGEWAEPTNRIWDAAWYMNGYAIRDWGTTAGGQTGNIRIFDPKTGQWHVTFFSAPGYGTGTWKGGKQDDDIVLSLPQQAPNGMDGESRLTFSGISSSSFNWLGEWVSADGSVAYPFWRIRCTKQPSLIN